MVYGILWSKHLNVGIFTYQTVLLYDELTSFNIFSLTTWVTWAPATDHNVPGGAWEPGHGYFDWVKIDRPRPHW